MSSYISQQLNCCIAYFTDIDTHMWVLYGEKHWPSHCDRIFVFNYAESVTPIKTYPSLEAAGVKA